MFCATHMFPHEDCPHCLKTVKAMRPTVFAELAAAELHSGTDCCRRCDYVFLEKMVECPRCAKTNPLNVRRPQPEQAWADTVPAAIDGLYVKEVEMLTPRDPAPGAALK